MQFSFVNLTSAAVIGLGITLTGTAAANAESVMAVCGAQWKTAKASGTTNGETWPQFLSHCSAEQKGAAAAPPASAPAPAPTTYAPGPAVPATVKTAKECDAEYSANKPAIKASGLTKKAYVANCRTGGTATVAAPAPMPAPTASAAPAPAPAAPAPSSIWPWPKSTEPQPQAAARPAAPVTASEAQAQALCPSDTVVWLNTKSGVYHFRGTHNYGNTKQGTYMCEAAAKGAGDRAAMNEKHP